MQDLHTHLENDLLEVHDEGRSWVREKAALLTEILLDRMGGGGGGLVMWEHKWSRTLKKGDEEPSKGRNIKIR